MKAFHSIQLDILHKLLYSNGLKFSEMKDVNMEGSQFTFHLDKLIAEKLIKRNNEGFYILTAKGKETANRIDIDSKTPTIQAKVSAVFCAINNDKFLIYKRLKNPFYGCQGFPTGKVQFGEKIVDAAERELLEETGLTGTPELVGIRHFRVYDELTKELLEDKVMYIHRIIDPKGELKSNSEGEFKWIDKNTIKSFIQNPLEEFWEIYEILTKFRGTITFKEVDHFTSKF